MRRTLKGLRKSVRRIEPPRIRAFVGGGALRGFPFVLGFVVGFGCEFGRCQFEIRRRCLRRAVSRARGVGRVPNKPHGRVLMRTGALHLTTPCVAPQAAPKVLPSTAAAPVARSPPTARKTGRLPPWLPSRIAAHCEARASPDSQE